MENIKEAFLKGFFERRAQKKRDEAHMAYQAAKQDMAAATAHHPIPKSVYTKWDKEFHAAGHKGHAAGWNHHADKFNAWIKTPEGDKWNTEQARKIK